MDNGNSITFEAVVEHLNNMAADIQKARLGAVRTNPSAAILGTHNQTNPPRSTEGQSTLTRYA